MKKLLFFFFSFLFSVFLANAQNHYVDGSNSNISADETWDYDTVFVDASVTIEDDVTLTINPGTKVIFLDFYKITVEGTIISEGTVSEPIIYTVADTSGYHNYFHTGWDGIEFDNENGDMDDNDTSRFVYSNFYFGYNKLEDWSEGMGGAVKLLYNSYATFSNCEFAHNTSVYWGGAIGIAYEATALIENCYFYDNNATGDINCSNGGGAIAIGCYDDDTFFDQTIISNCTFYKNGSWDIDGGSHYGGGAIKISGYSDALVVNCTFNENYSSTQGGAMIISGHAHPYIVNNVFYNNYAEHNGGAIALKYYAGGFHFNNTIMNNYSNHDGGAVSIGCDNDSCYFANNIIWLNDDANYNTPVVPSIINPSNYPAFYIDSPDNNMKFYNNNIEGGLGNDSIDVTHNNNIDENPFMVDPGNNDFRLRCNSPSVNAGKNTLRHLPSHDIIGTLRKINGVIDMGAYETLEIDTVNPSMTCVNHTVYLNQGETYYTIRNSDFDPTNYDDNCHIASITNNINSTQTLDGEQFPAGTHDIEWTITDYADNSYTCNYQLIVNQYNNINNIYDDVISIYPNPTINGIINFEFANDDNYLITITDLFGKLIISQITNNQKEIIDISEYANGLYLINVKSDNENFTTKLIKE
jgi:hypothetical protein